MNIFIDEAGVFVVPGKNRCSISCIGGLVIPEMLTEEVFSDFTALKRSWGVGTDEIKGSRLSEQQVQSLVSLLQGYDIIFQVVAIDMNRQNNKGIVEHKTIQGRNFIKHLTPQHQPGLIQDIYKLKSELEGLSLQLYVQTVCTLELLTDLLQTMLIYYVGKMPEELGRFSWVVDAKDKMITPYEKLWTSIVLPMQQARSFSDPFITIHGADYSYFEKFCRTDEIAPEHIRAHVKKPTPFQCIVGNDIYGENICFESSHANLGIQMVDILTTTMRRAMNGKLGIAGWSDVGRLMVTPLRKKQVVHLVDLCDEGIMPYIGEKYPPFYQVIEVTDRTCRPILV